MHIKKTNRINRAKRIRANISILGINRLCINRNSRHIYAHITSYSNILISASTLEYLFKKENIYTGNIESAKKIGFILASRAKKSGISSVAFDRSGYKYHGRIKALANAARKGGLQF
ncbi:50S ribosomal protein L18 [Candidatus Johnevansia muelleri]|uniref:Large ribosomal subunit protein uL18 n=1 Tax=Candidatus Johnevansia muelleri TaxID=1495769 RepID=A0A078KDV2_9GAMM|nr:50S ribosomal protein L18 [Candidatus Evansia muelleri]